MGIEVRSDELCYVEPLVVNVEQFRLQNLRNVKNLYGLY